MFVRCGLTSRRLYFHCTIQVLGSKDQNSLDLSLYLFSYIFSLFSLFSLFIYCQMLKNILHKAQESH